jgi:hypothetical protein
MFGAPSPVQRDTDPFVVLPESVRFHRRSGLRPLQPLKIIKLRGAAMYQRCCSTLYESTPKSGELQ